MAAYQGRHHQRRRLPGSLAVSCAAGYIRKTSQRSSTGGPLHLCKCGHNTKAAAHRRSRHRRSTRLAAEGKKASYRPRNLSTPVGGPTVGVTVRWARFRSESRSPFRARPSAACVGLAAGCCASAASRLLRAYRHWNSAWTMGAADPWSIGCEREDHSRMVDKNEWVRPSRLQDQPIRGCLAGAAEYRRTRTMGGAAHMFASLNACRAHIPSLVSTTCSQGLSRCSRTQACQLAAISSGATPCGSMYAVFPQQRTEAAELRHRRCRRLLLLQRGDVLASLEHQRGWWHWCHPKLGSHWEIRTSAHMHTIAMLACVCDHA